jgi:hypothetical protein
MFGPSEGFQAYAWPDRKRFEDNSLALSSGKFELFEGGSVHQITRFPMADGSVLVRFALYRQVYEPRMPRRGHTFGAAIEVHGFNRNLTTVFAILDALVADLEARCVVDRQFCGPERFRTFVFETLDQNFSLIGAQLVEGEELDCFNPNTQKMLYREVDDSAPLSSQITDLWHWFLGTPEGMFSAPSFLVAIATAGKPGPDLEPFVSKRENDTVAARKLLSNFRNVRRERDQAISEADVLRRELDELKAVPPPTSVLVESDFQRLASDFQRLAAALLDRSLVLTTDAVGGIRKDIEGGFRSIVPAIGQELAQRYPASGLSLGHEQRRRGWLGGNLIIVLVFLIGLLGGWAVSDKGLALLAVATEYKTERSEPDTSPPSSQTPPSITAEGAFALATAQMFRLSYTNAGDAEGAVLMSPGGLTCEGACSVDFAAQTEVTLTALPEKGSTFVGWSVIGSCAGAGPCKVTMSADRPVTATFKKTPSVNVVIQSGRSSGGKVTSSPEGITCPGTCSAEFPNGGPVTLSVTPGDQAAFDKWSSPCKERNAKTCTVDSSALSTVTATFKVRN